MENEFTRERAFGKCAGNEDDSNSEQAKGFSWCLWVCRYSQTVLYQKNDLTPLSISPQKVLSNHSGQKE